MDIFDKIEELEAKNSIHIQDKLSIFCKINTDYEFFQKTVINNKTQKEVSIDPISQNLIEDLLSNKNIYNKIESNLKERTKEKLDSEQNTKPKVRKERKKVFDSKANGSNLTVSKYISNFNQNYMNTKKNYNNFFSKESEFDYLTKYLKNKITETIKAKFFIYFSEYSHLNGIKPAEEDFNLGEELKSMHAIKNDDLDMKEKAKIIQKNINRLYPKPTPKEDHLNDTSYINKINECRRQGFLCKKVDIDELMKKMKITKPKLYDRDLINDVNSTQIIINSYNNLKFLRKEASGKDLQNNSMNKNFAIGDIEINDSNFAHTKNKLYIKIDRNKQDLTIIGEK